MTTENNMNNYFMPKGIEIDDNGKITIDSPQLAALLKNGKVNFNEDDFQPEIASTFRSGPGGGTTIINNVC
ncbi:hypothetical protein B7492_32475 (plasmid) [Bacillus mycoides]|uniref:Uncharacterized protein n=1 Tax=Bacillus mycoides TaxID=1405 RepID=A0A1W6AIT3_BACMY|nr:hypothetical protein [Bacillus mycoides]ARJ25757.1 hypothetical protein B7492_32475 [Bacillus mycoides]